MTAVMADKDCVRAKDPSLWGGQSLGVLNNYRLLFIRENG